MCHFLKPLKITQELSQKMSYSSELWYGSCFYDVYYGTENHHLPPNFFLPFLANILFILILWAYSKIIIGNNIDTILFFKESARQFLLVQFGLCTFHYNPKDGKFSNLKKIGIRKIRNNPRLCISHSVSPRCLPGS